METAQTILFLLLGFSAYWLVKVRAIIHGYNRQNTFSDFARDYLIEILLSVVAVVFVGAGGGIIGLTLDTPTNAFIAGGAAPSMLNNVLANFFKK
jgi:hypothetical protein